LFPKSNKAPPRGGTLIAPDGPNKAGRLLPARRRQSLLALRVFSGYRRNLMLC